MDHFYMNIPGWAAFTTLYAEAVKGARDGAIFVEVGSWLGCSAAFMGVEIINSGKQIEFCCVDPWEDGGPDLRYTEWYQNLPEHVRVDLFKQFLHNTKPVSSVIKPLKMTSLDAALLYEDESIDFLMLDGDHNYPAVKQDIQAWLPKMKKGGVLSGDDYRWPGVTQSVEETIGSNHIGIRDIRKDRNYKLSASYWFYRVK